MKTQNDFRRKNITEQRLIKSLLEMKIIILILVIFLKMKLLEMKDK